MGSRENESQGGQRKDINEKKGKSGKGGILGGAVGGLAVGAVGRVLVRQAKGES